MTREELISKISSKKIYLIRRYGELAENWKNETDDRGYFSNKYFEIMEALRQFEELKECNDYLYYDVLAPQINRDKRDLEEIKEHFTHKEQVNIDVNYVYNTKIKRCGA